MDYKKIAYYIARFGYIGLDKDKLDKKLIKKNILKDFKKVLLEFRVIAYKKSFDSLNASTDVLKTHYELKNKTSMELRLEVQGIISK